MYVAKLEIHCYKTYNDKVLELIHSYYSYNFFLIQIHLDNIYYIEHFTSQSFNILESISFTATHLCNLELITSSL